MKKPSEPPSPLLPVGSAPDDASSPISSSPQLSTPNAQPPAIPDHELLRRIGGGSYGEVWLARSVMGTYRAVKIVHRITFEHDRPFEREFAGIQKFEPISRSHEGLVDLLQVGRNEAEGYFYYVMELADDASGEKEKRGEGEKGSKTHGPVASGEAAVSSSPFSPASYTPRTLRSLLGPNTQPSTINPQPNGRLPLNECIQLGLSLTEALNYLHNQGLVHRDIKPSNIIFVGGVPKLADVGLVTGVDEARSYVGTEGFMPPEGPGTPQADLYSLGILLYQMSTGKSHQDFPEPLPDLAAQPDHDRWLEFNAVVHKACASDPRERYQNAGEMHAELALLQRGESVKRRRTLERRRGFAKTYGFAAAAAALVIAVVWLLASRFEFVKIHRPGTPSSSSSAPFANTFIAVLPFDNESPDKADEYLGASTANEISSALTKVPGLIVLGRDSGIALKKSKDLNATAGQLKLQAVLNGTVRKSGSKVHVTAQLIRPAGGSLLWSEVYDRPWSEIFGIQTDIAENVAANLNIELTDTVRTRLAVKRTKNFEAYQFYLEGCDFLNKGDQRQAIAFLQSAIALDTNFAPAYVALADAFIVEAHEAVSGREAFPRAFENVKKAVQLAPGLAEAHAALARIKSHYEYDWEGAEKEFQLALKLDPNNANAHQKYSQYLGITGRFDEAIAHARLARKLDPLSHLDTLGWNLYDARRYDEALEEFKKILELDENSTEAFDGVGWCHWVKGQQDEAITAWGRATSPEIRAELSEAYREHGMQGYWKKHLEQTKKGVDPSNKSSFWIACDYAMLGDKDQAFEWLEKAYEERAFYLPWVGVEYRLYNLHSDPRFTELLMRMGLSNPPLATNAPTQAKTIAVLPFDNASADKADEYLGAQMAWEVASALTKIPELRVLPQDSATTLKNAKDRSAAVAQLGLTAVLDGSIQKTGNQLRLTAQLINTADGFALGSDTYETDMKDIFGLQTRVSESVAEKLNLKLTDSVRARLASKTTKDWAAYNMYLAGRHELEQPGRSYERAMDYFQSALRFDTNYALAYEGLARCYLLEAEATQLPKDSCLKALATAEKAVGMNTNLAEAWTALAEARNRLYDWTGAEQAIKRAFELKPDYARAHRFYGKYLSSQGRFDEAIAHSRRAKEKDPFSFRLQLSFAWTLFDARRYDEAKAEFEKMLQVDPDSTRALGGLGDYYDVKGRYDAAFVQLIGTHRRWGASDEKLAALTNAYQSGGMRGFRRKELDYDLEGASKSDHVNSFWIAVGYTDIGEYDEAFNWLERAYQEHHALMPLVALEHRLYPLHSDPRFSALLEKMGLPMPVWKE